MMRFTLSVVLLWPLAIASAGDPPPAPPPKRTPPPAAFDACAKSKIGDACTFKGRRGRDLSGTCQTPPDNGKALVCHVAWNRGGGSGGGGGSGSAH